MTFKASKCPIAENLVGQIDFGYSKTYSGKLETQVAKIIKRDSFNFLTPHKSPDVVFRRNVDSFYKQKLLNLDDFESPKSSVNLLNNSLKYDKTVSTN